MRKVLESLNIDDDDSDVGSDVEMGVEERHGFAAQGPRRKAIGRARNYLLYSALKPDHSWVYWRDVDIVDCPEHILEDFVAHDKDILVPSMDGPVKARTPLITCRYLVPPI